MSYIAIAPDMAAVAVPWRHSPWPPVAAAAPGEQRLPATSGSTGGSRQAAFNAAVTQIVNPSTKTGGTLKLGARATATRGTRRDTYYALVLGHAAAVQPHADGLPGACPGPTQDRPRPGHRPG